MLRGITARLKRDLANRVILIAGFFLCAVIVCGIVRPEIVRNAQEDALFFFDRNEARAFMYGERHFNARTPSEYDMNRAQYFFTQTLTLNPTYPLAYHELARISFLKGNLPLALSFINTEFLVNKHPSPASYYVRALIKAYMKDYRGAAKDYESYFAATPATWGSINDYAWVLMKLGYPKAALAALDWGLIQWPGNAWLLSNKATALYELKDLKSAQVTALAAQKSVLSVSVGDWFDAYPGNDPLIANQGLDVFKKSVANNVDLIQAALKQKTIKQ